VNNMINDALPQRDIAQILRSVDKKWYNIYYKFSNFSFVLENFCIQKKGKKWQL
jgi:hypothetical protein